MKVGRKLAPYNPTSLDAIQIAMQMLQIRKDDKVYDLGCGDGRFLIECCLVESSIKGVGVEYDQDIYLKAVENVKAHQLSDRVMLLHENVLNVDFRDASVVFVYLVPEGMMLLKDRLSEVIKSGVRVVSYVFSIPGLQPTRVEVFKGSVKLYLYC